MRFFIAGLSEPLHLRCLTDADGNAWKSLTKLIDYAYGQEMALIATRRYAQQQRKVTSHKRLHFVRHKQVTKRYGNHNRDRDRGNHSHDRDRAPEKSGEKRPLPIGPDGNRMTHKQYVHFKRARKCWN